MFGKNLAASAVVEETPEAASKRIQRALDDLNKQEAAAIAHYQKVPTWSRSDFREDHEATLQKINNERAVLQQAHGDLTSLIASREAEANRAGDEAAREAWREACEKSLGRLLPVMIETLREIRLAENRMLERGIALDVRARLNAIWALGPAGGVAGVHEETVTSRFVDALREAGCEIPKFYDDDVHVPNPTPWMLAR